MGQFDLNPEERDEDVLNEENEDFESEDEGEDLEETEETDSEEEGVDEEQEESEEASGENPLIPIVYTSQDGKQYQREIAYDDLGRIVYEAEQRRELDEQTNKFMQTAVPLVNEVNDSQILQHILYYRSQGHSEEAIKAGLVKLWGDELAKNKKEYSSYDEEIRDTTLKEVEHRLKPMEKKLVEMEEQRQFQMAKDMNNAVLDKVMRTNNLDPRNVTEAQYKELAFKLQKLNPGKKIHEILLDEVVADMLIKSTLVPAGAKGQAKPVSKAKAIIGQLKAPKVLPGNAGIKASSKTVKGRTEDKVTTMEERIMNKQKLFSNS